MWAVSNGFLWDFIINVHKLFIDLTLYLHILNNFLVTQSCVRYIKKAHQCVYLSCPVMCYILWHVLCVEFNSTCVVPEHTQGHEKCVKNNTFVLRVGWSNPDKQYLARLESLVDLNWISTNGSLLSGISTHLQLYLDFNVKNRSEKWER